MPSVWLQSDSVRRKSRIKWCPNHCLRSNLSVDIIYWFSYRICDGQPSNLSTELVLTTEEEMDAELQILTALVDRRYKVNFERFSRSKIGFTQNQGVTWNAFRRREICPLVHQQFHNLTQYSLQMLSLILAFSNTVVNPIIYAVLYPQFRMQLINLHRRVKSICKSTWKLN